MTAREAAFLTGLDLFQASRLPAPQDGEAEQDLDLRQLEADRLRRCLAAALRRQPTVREFRRALAAWEKKQ